MSNFKTLRVDVPIEVYDLWNAKLKEYGNKSAPVLRTLVKDWADGNIVNKHNARI